MNLTDQQIYDRLAQIKVLPTCSQWHAGFSDSIREQIDRGRHLTERQRAACYKILSENSPEEVQKVEKWANEYKEHHLEQAFTIANYYKAQTAGYYGDVVGDILADKVPNRAKYLRMINNKYAKKVVIELDRTPRFTIEDQIIPNSKFAVGYGHNSCMMETGEAKLASMKEQQGFLKRGGIIIEVGNTIKSAAKGSKRYKVLPFGSVKTYWCEERFLKKKPKVKVKK